MYDSRQANEGSLTWWALYFVTYSIFRLSSILNCQVQEWQCILLCFSRLYNDGGVCAVSTKSVVAFTRMTTKQDNYRHRTPVCSICVMDLNSPNEPHVLVHCIIEFAYWCLCHAIMIISIIVANILACLLIKRNQPKGKYSTKVKSEASDIWRCMVLDI